MKYKGCDVQIALKAKSSGGEKPYLVTFRFDNDRLFVSCNCQAGRYGKFCKHKWGLLRGVESFLYDENQYDDLEKISNWVQKSQYFDLIVKMSKANAVLEKINKDIKSIKKEVEKAMKHGLSKTF